MDYTSYFTPAPQTFNYLGFGNDASTANSHEASNGSNTATQSMELEPNFEANLSNFMPGVFEYNLDNASMGGSNINTTTTNRPGMMRHNSSSSSPSDPVHSLSSMDGSGMINMELEGETNLLGGREDRRSDSVDKEILTPAQSRRKAQNRAAQRAFRERKERHVRDLESKLHQLTSTTSSLQTDNERLRLLLQRTQTENEILKATASASSSPAGQNHHHHPPCFVDDPNSLSSPNSSKSITSSDDDHFTTNRSSPAASHSSHSSLASGMSSPKNGNLSSVDHAGRPHKLTPHAAWEILQSHPLFARGILDISLICERLKQLAKSDNVTGGPMFDEGEVRAAVEELGKDEDDAIEGSV